MNTPLPLDVTRCLGDDCHLAFKCQRHLTMPLDIPYDEINGPQHRSYTASVKLPEAMTCIAFREDK